MELTIGTETFAPVTKMSSLRILISIGVKFGRYLCMCIEQADAVSEFLQAKLEEEIYVKARINTYT